MKILWVTNIPSPYRIDFFSLLGEQVNLTVLFEREDSIERDESWKVFNFENFNGIILSGLKIGIDTSLCLNIGSYLKKESYDFIIISNPLTPTGILAINYLHLHNIPFLIESDGGIPTQKNFLVEFIKKSILRKASGWFSTGKLHNEYYLKYGAQKDKIYKYPFTSIKKNQIINQVLTYEEKLLLRKELNLPQQGLISITVGSFIKRKGIDILIKSWREVDPNNSLVVIGGGPEESYYRELINKYKLQNIYLYNFMLKEELFKYYKACDLFILPTREDIWGLVINEAMCCGLPIITTDKCVAGIELIENEKNGFIISLDNDMELTNRINEILSDNQLRFNMSMHNLNKIKEYTLENMVVSHLNILNDLKKKGFNIS